jgi:hypothetical protein
LEAFSLKIQFRDLTEPLSKRLHDAEILPGTAIPEVGELVCIGFVRYRVSYREFHYETESEVDLIIFAALE